MKYKLKILWGTFDDMYWNEYTYGDGWRGDEDVVGWAYGTYQGGGYRSYMNCRPEYKFIYEPGVCF